MICPHCGKEHPDEASFCPATGKSISANKICPHCGESHPVDMQFCPKTGKEIAVQPISTKPKKKSKVWIVLFMLFVVLAICAGGVWAVGSGAINIPFIPLYENPQSAPTEELAKASPTVESSKTPLPILSPTIDRNSISTIVASTVEAQLTQPAVNTPRLPFPPSQSSSRDLLDEIKERGYILVATDPNYAPISFLNTTGSRPRNTKCPSDALTTNEMQGFDVDVAVLIGDSIGIETCFVTPSWDWITAGNWADKWDISVGSMTITTSRQKDLDFSIPYYYTPAAIAVRSDSGIQSIFEINGKSLCVGTYTTHELWLNGDLDRLGLPASSIYIDPPTVSIVTLESDRECAQASAAGQDNIVGYVTSESVIDANIAAGFPITKLSPPVFSEEMAIAFDKSASLSTKTLREEMDRILFNSHSDGLLSSFSIKWLGEDLTQDPRE